MSNCVSGDKSNDLFLHKVGINNIEHTEHNTRHM